MHRRKRIAPTTAPITTAVLVLSFSDTPTYIESRHRKACVNAAMIQNVPIYHAWELHKTYNKKS